MILWLVDEKNVIFDEFSVASSDLGFIAFYWAGFTVAQSESAQEHRKVPYFTNPPFTYERQPQHRDHPTLFE